MKRFSARWIKSARAGKQRKFRANAPSHIKHRMLGSSLSKELRKKYSRRSFPLRKGDTVRIMTGKFREKSGKVIEVDVKRTRVYIEGMQLTKKDGSKVNVPFQCSNLMITELNIDDKKRAKAIKKAEQKEAGK